ncbi:hypothetical protein [Streptomyces syringium]|uniref:hypothetical protein n=1 Tax=Streptomyces syringium TaxID=76729 RepID=UPI003454F70F
MTRPLIDPAVTPADLAALADRIETLRGELALTTNRLRHGSDDARTIGYRLDDQVGTLKHVADELGGAAADLEHITTARQPRRCPVEWRACPEHGPTPRNIASEALTRCTRSGCTRTWNPGRVGPAVRGACDPRRDRRRERQRRSSVPDTPPTPARLFGATITPLTAQQA